MKKRNASSGLSPLLVLSVLIATVFVDRPQTVQHLAPEQTSVVQSVLDLPLNFEANQGQTDDSVDFLARGQGYTLFLTPEAAILRVADSTTESEDVVRIVLRGASTYAPAAGVDQVESRTHYLTGNNRSAWRADVRSFERVRYDDVYPGIDVEYYGNGGELEYDFVVHPGASPQDIAIRFEGAERVTLDDGDLLVQVGQKTIRQLAPIAYQRSGDRMTAVTSNYALSDDGTVRFDLAAYDVNQPLIIDPVVQYSTYLGGGLADRGLAIAVDESGNAYVVGETRSLDFPLASSPQTDPETDADVFIAKLNATGTGLLFATYVGGSGRDRGNDVVIDASGSICITGETASTDFPVIDASQPDYGGGEADAFVTRISSDGSTIEFSTYIGGSGDDRAYGIDVDAGNEIFIAGESESEDLPMANAVQAFGGQSDAFAAVVDGPTSTINFCTFLGGSAPDRGRDVVAWGDGEAYIVGWTSSADFPVENAIQDTYGGGEADGFVVRIDARQGSVDYATYVGGQAGDRIFGVATDAERRAYFIGESSSTDFPTANALQDEIVFGFDAVTGRLAADGSVFEYSTFLGGAGGDRGRAVEVDADGRVILAGGTSSPNFPTVSAVQPNLNGVSDAFVVGMASDGAQLEFSSFYGGSKADPANGLAVDADNRIYLSGTTMSLDFPVQLPLQNGLAGMGDAFVVRFGDTAAWPDTSCTVDVPPDSTLPGMSSIPDVELDGFEIRNTSAVPVAFDYVVTESGLGTLDDNGDPLSLAGRTPLLAPGESFVPSNPVMQVPPIRHYRELIVTYSVFPVAREDLGHIVNMSIFVEPPVPVFITSFSGRAVERGVALEWDIFADEAVQGFKVYRATGDGNPLAVNGSALIDPLSRGYLDEEVRGGEIYRYTLSVIDEDGAEILSPVVTIEAQARGLALEQNHPNPFNPTTTIEFALPSEGRAELLVFDAKGQRVRTLRSGTLSAGPHSVTWDGRDDAGSSVSSGVYFYRLRASNQTLTRKMLLLK